MTRIEFYATIKVVCEHDEQGYYGDQTLEDVKQTAINRLTPNFHTIERGTKLKSVEFEFHDDDNKTEDAYNFTSCPDLVFIDNEYDRHTADDFYTENAPKAMVQYVIDNIPDFDERYSRMMEEAAKNRCPLHRADQSLYMEMLDCIDDWCNDNEDNSDLYSIQEIFG